MTSHSWLQRWLKRRRQKRKMDKQWQELNLQLLNIDLTQAMVHYAALKEKSRIEREVQKRRAHREYIR